MAPRVVHDGSMTMASPRDVSPPAVRALLHEGDAQASGECRRLLGCNLAIAMVCVLFMLLGLW